MRNVRFLETVFEYQHKYNQAKNDPCCVSDSLSCFGDKKFKM